jgi:hypothetical protein
MGLWISAPRPRGSQESACPPLQTAQRGERQGAPGPSPGAARALTSPSHAPRRTNAGAGSIARVTPSTPPLPYP